MNYNDVILAARGNIGSYCKACNICNGIACKNTIPGPGAKGMGDVAIRNFNAWQNIRLNMDTITEKRNIDTKATLFGKSFDLPVFAGPVGAVKLHYGEQYTEENYNSVLINSTVKNGIAAFTGDGVDPQVMKSATSAIKNANGLGIPTVKPWNIETIKEKFALIKESGAFAVAMDIDAAGLPFLKNLTPPAGSKSPEELKEIISLSPAPFIVKGIMTVNGAIKAVEAGASGIIVSNHGGRVLDGCPATAEVLPQIVKSVGNKTTILVDGGIRTGTDVFKALALGADGVVIARPFVTAVYGKAGEGVAAYIAKLKTELADTMEMCGAYNIKEINSDMLYL